MKLAILYDWVDKWGGAERILNILYRAYPGADLYTLYADYKGAVWAKEHRPRLRTTFVNRLYRYVSRKELLAPLMPMAVETLDLTGYDTVLSLSSSFMKGVLTRPETKHICYLFCPTRFLWHEHEQYARLSWITAPVFASLRRWDYIAAQRPDLLLTLSGFDRQLIRKYYGRKAEVFYPPFEPEYWRNLKPQPPPISLAKSYFLSVGRLEPYKKTDLLVEAFRMLPDHNLVVVGTGTEERNLRKKAGPNTVFLNGLKDTELAWLYKHAEATVMPQSEDFGYAALESLSLNTPVISYSHSGVAEFVKHGENGLLFSSQSKEGVLEAVAKLRTNSYNFSHLDWSQFSKERFLKKLKTYTS